MPCRVGRERLAVGPHLRSASSLDALSHLINRQPVGNLVASLYPVPKADAGWQSLATVKALLLAMGAHLPGMNLVTAPHGRASFY